MKFKIAVVQLSLDDSSVENRFEKIESYLQKATRKADLIVFPEYIFSWNFQDKHGELRQKFQVLARKYKLDIVTGSMQTQYKTKIFNTVYYIDSKGKVKGKYHKINLWHPERPYLTSGSEVEVFNTKWGKIGLTICWDLAFPEVYRSMVKKGAKIIICSSFWSNQDASSRGLHHNPQAEEIFIDSCCLSRACENEIIHVFCNAAGKFKFKNKKWTLTGHSQITGPFKGVFKKLNHNQEEMFIQEVDTSIIDDAEKAYKIRKDLKKI